MPDFSSISSKPNSDLDLSSLQLPQLRLIVAMDQNQLIGSNNQLPWHLPLDLKLFKLKTLYQHVVMGYNTFDSIIQRLGKPLPHRTHWVLTHKNLNDLPAYHDVHYINDFNQANLHLQNTAQNIWIIGGAQIYRLFKDHPQLIELHITRIQKTYQGDAYFDINLKENWQIKEDLTLLSAYQNYQNHQNLNLPKMLSQDLQKQFLVDQSLIKSNLSEEEQNTNVQIYTRVK
jgi:dihydrofolate reductase